MLESVGRGGKEITRPGVKMVWYARSTPADGGREQLFRWSQYVSCKASTSSSRGSSWKGREKLKSEMEEVAWGSEGSYVERSNEDGRTTSTVVARMRDHGAYAG